MGSILIDNWTIEGAMKSFDIDAKINFLSALLLWDEVWFYDNITSSAWKRELEESSLSDSFYKIVYPVDVNFFSNDVMKYLDSTYFLKNDERSSNSIAFYAATSPKLSKKRSDLYKLIGSTFGINSLLHEKRIDKGNNWFSRLDLLDKIDKELKEYYDFVNNQLGKKLYSFSFPILYDYIKKHANTWEEEVSFAMSLHSDKDIIEFRQSVDVVEEIVNNGNTQALLTQLRIISDSAQEITNKYNKTLDLGSLKLSLSPSLSKISFDKELSLKTKWNRSQKIHTSFIKRLISFGVNERKI